MTATEERPTSSAMDVLSAIGKLRQDLAGCYGQLVALENAYAEEKADNSELREELAKARDPQRIGGQADPESFVYAIEQLREFRWQHATNDEDAIPYINNVAAAHERENAKLRELVRETLMDVDDYTEKYGIEHSYDAVDAHLNERLRALGIEVDG